MTGYVTCKHCHGVGKTFKWLIFPKCCPYCNGLGDIWLNSTCAIDEYYENKDFQE